MLEFIVMLGAAALVFGLFILAFLLKKTPKDEPVQIHTCARCRCDRKKSVTEPGFVLKEKRGEKNEEARRCGTALNEKRNLSA